MIQSFEHLSQAINFYQAAGVLLAETAGTPGRRSPVYPDQQENVLRSNLRRHGMSVYIDPDRCVGCGACITECPASAIRMLPGWRSQADPDRCTGCGNCVRICHKNAPRFID